MTGERRRLLLALAGTVVLLAPLAWMWQASRLPATYSVLDMGYADYGGGPRPAAHSEHAGRSVDTLVAPAGRADVRRTLTARSERFRLASGAEVDGYTVNGTSPGPVVRAVQGQLVEVVLVNESVPDGVALHWHGVNVPNAADGVAGVTQDAVLVGEAFTYRFVAEEAGTFWYHSHQVSHVQVQRGLLGALVVTPRRPAPPAGQDELAVMHVYDGTPTVNGRVGDVRVAARNGTTVRVRVVNTDNGVTSVWTSGAPYRVLAVDGRDLSRPTPVRDQAVRLTAGGRVDLEVRAPARVELGSSSALVLGSGAATDVAADQPTQQLDLLGYGSPAPLRFDPARADRSFRYAVGRRPGFVSGRPGMWWSVNGRLFPDVPMFVVQEGDVVRMRLENSSGQAHPMHLHGHRAVVLARNGVQATGSPWEVDSLEVGHGESYDIAFLADNPGIWMDHCHNLPHAAEGLVAHLMYAGVSEPFRVGGPKRNRPE